MIVKLILALSVLIVATAENKESEKDFDNDLQLTEQDSGGTLRLRSRGKLSNIVDLDNTECVKRVLCKGQKILIALKSNVSSISWKPGQLVIGSHRWQCSNNANNPQSRTIYTKVEEVKTPKENVIELHTSAAGPLDMFEEASIQVHYEQGTKAPLRQKRYLSNPLRKMLNHVDWNASFVSNIPFNEIGTKENKSFCLTKLKNVANARLNMANDLKHDGKQFLFRCLSCHGHSQVSYVFELKVKKVDNRAQVLKYMMQLDIESTIMQNYSIDTEEEITLTNYATLGRQAPEQMFQTPIAVFKTFPPIMLKVDYKTQENLELTSKSRNETKYSGGFTARGKTVITQIFEKDQPSINDVTAYNWTVVSKNEQLNTNSSANATFAFFQNMTIAPAISWAQKDVDVNLGPPVHISIRPKVNVVSTSDGTARCSSSSVSIDSNVSVAETDFSVDAFGFHIWNVKLMDRLSRRINVLQQSLMKTCRADCHAPLKLNCNQTMEQACGDPSDRITRGDEKFKGLQQLWGDFILFASEGDENDTWCGYPGRKCLSCFNHTVGEGAEKSCATRMATPALATSLSRLAKLVEAEWKNRKVFVRELWDQPTSENPGGRHGNHSVFTEGRAARLTLTKPILDLSVSVEMETESQILGRLAELAVCSGFQYVQQEEVHQRISGCVARNSITHVKRRSLLSRRRQSGEVHHPSVKSILQKVGTALSSAKSNISLPDELSEGTSYPPGISMDRACGDVTGVVSQDNLKRMKRLVQYPLDDVKFRSEGPLNTWCGVETRRCRNCSVTVDDTHVTNPWLWCATRTMTMRLAIRLHRLSVLTNSQIIVTRGHTVKLAANMSNLYTEGRAARIEVSPGSLLNMQELTSHAKLAGFDYVIFPSPDYIEVCVKLQDGEEAQIVHFPLSTLLAVPLPLDEQEEYAYPPEHALETRKPLLFDISTSSNGISEHFKLHMFTSTGARFLRLDPVLINLLEIAYDSFLDRFYIMPGSGYRIRSVNRNNIDSRHSKEKYRFQMGQAVEIKPSGRVNDETLFYLAVALMKAGRTVQTQRLGIGIGSKKDRLYFHIRPLTLDTEDEAIDIWNSGNPAVYEKLNNILEQIRKGGFIITAKSDNVVCGSPILGSDYFYFGFELEESGYCWTARDDFCSETLESRRNISVKFQISLTSAAGSGKLPRPDITPEIENCIVNTCGGCPDGVPLITATYKRGSTEELIFGGADNPSPLLEIVEQELAWRAEGKVDIFIDSLKDVSALRNVLKIIMMLNKNVTEVIYHIDPDIDETDVTNTLQRKLEEWSGSVCPQWSRLVVAPYTVEIIPHARKRRSLDRSKNRNKMKEDMNNWEIDWILKS